ncbi:MAG: alpha/beta hydrolase [bacterium]|nr:alpha/beta hydrolase [bacterium]
MARLPAPLALLLLAACQAPAPEPESTAVAEPVVETMWEATSSDGVPIAYEAEGSGETAVVLIHGWACDRTYWRHQIEPLLESYQVVTVDLAGHGSSGVERADWTMPAFGEDIKAVVEELGLGRVVLVGHSMGGPAALEAARLLGDRVLGVVAVDALHDVGSRPDPDQWASRMEAYETDFAGSCGQFVRSMFLDTADPEIVESTAMDMCGAPPEVATALMGQFGAYDQAAILGAVEVPVRAINSVVYPTNLEGNRAVAADFDVEVYEGVGHFPMLVIPEELNEMLLEVLAELTAEPA